MGVVRLKETRKTENVGPKKPDVDSVAQDWGFENEATKKALEYKLMKNYKRKQQINKTKLNADQKLMRFYNARDKNMFPK